MTLWGMDISNYQPSTPSMAGLDFVCVKASQRDFVDSTWANHERDVRRAGKFLIAYHFGEDFDVPTQVRTFLSVASHADAWVLDRDPSYKDCSGAWHYQPTPKQCAEFIDRMGSAGYPCGIYVNCSNHIEAGQAWTWLADPGNYCPSTHREMVQTRSGVPRGDHSDLPDLSHLIGGTKVQSFVVTNEDIYHISVPRGTNVYTMGGQLDHSTAEAKPQIGLARGQLSGGSTHYWVVALEINGEKRLGLVKVPDVTAGSKVGDGGGGGGGGGHGGSYDQGFTDARAKAVQAVEDI